MSSTTGTEHEIVLAPPGADTAYYFVVTLTDHVGNEYTVFVLPLL